MAVVDKWTGNIIWSWTAWGCVAVVDKWTGNIVWSWTVWGCERGSVWLLWTSGQGISLMTVTVCVPETDRQTDQDHNVAPPNTILAPSRSPRGKAAADICWEGN